MLLRLQITLVFYIGVVCYSVFGFQESIRQQTLCKDKEPAILNCSNDRVISIQKMKSQINKCNIKVFEYVEKKCNGQNTCNVTSNELHDECKRFARYLRIDIGCSRFWASTKYRSFYECSNSLSNIHCRNYWNRHLHIKGVDVLGDNINDHSCVLNRVKSLCNEQETCSEESSENSCLFEGQYMHIFYICSDNSTQTTSNTSIEAVTLETSTKEMFTESTESVQRNFSIVLNGSLMLIQATELSNSSNVLCADTWNDKAASVICKFLNRSMDGRATKISNPNNYNVIFVTQNCTGHESSPFDCDGRVIEKTCSSTMVAGVVCCEDETSCPNQTSSSPSQKSIGDTETSYTGLAVGLALVAVTALLGTLVVIYLRHRGRLKFICFDKLKKPSRYTSDNDYLGQQGISLPESSRGNARHEINNDNNENETLYENQPKHPIDSTENEQFYSLASSPEDQTQYATAKEGEYDVTNSRRHVANDGNLYDHSVDTVYDSTGNQGSNPTSDSTYARTVDNVYDGTARKRTNDRGTDGVSLGTYNHSSETAYDVRFFNKSQSNHYDA